MSYELNKEAEMLDIERYYCGGYGDNASIILGCYMTENYNSTLSDCGELLIKEGDLIGVVYDYRHFKIKG